MAQTMTEHAHGKDRRRSPRTSSPVLSVRLSHSISPARPEATQAAKRLLDCALADVPASGTAAMPVRSKPVSRTRCSIHSRSELRSSMYRETRRLGQRNRGVHGGTERGAYD